MSRQEQRRTPADAESFEAYGEYQSGAPAPEHPPQTADAAQRVRREQERRQSHVLWRFLVLLAVIAVGIVVAQRTLFRAETVYVIGVRHRTADEIAQITGLVRGQNMLSIEEEEIAKAISQDHTIIFKDMQKEYPSTIYLHIEERETAAAMLWLGILYTLDDQGMVMTEENSAILPSGLPVVTGLNANSVTVGRPLEARDGRQLEAYQKIMYELKQQLYADQVTGINVSDPQNLYLVTLEGVTVRLGNAEYMEGKIGAIRTCMSHLRQLRVSGGILDVTDVKDLSSGENEAKYMPENAE